jgi:hypothetical protein
MHQASNDNTLTDVEYLGSGACHTVANVLSDRTAHIADGVEGDGEAVGTNGTARKPEEKGRRHTERVLLIGRRAMRTNIRASGTFVTRANRPKT